MMKDERTGPPPGTAGRLGRDGRMAELASRARKSIHLASTTTESRARKSIHPTLTTTAGRARKSKVPTILIRGSDRIPAPPFIRTCAFYFVKV